MKVVYLKNTGGYKRGDIKEVAEGYARNFLLPQQLAAPATRDNLAKLKQEVDKTAKVKVAAIDKSKVLADKIKGKRVEIKAKANNEGKLYAAISEKEVKAALQRLGFDIKDAKIIFPVHIKEAGDYEVTVDFGSGIHSSIIILVRL